MKVKKFLLFSGGLTNVILGTTHLGMSLDLVLDKTYMKPLILERVQLISKELWMAGIMKLMTLTITLLIDTSKFQRF